MTRPPFLALAALLAVAAASAPAAQEIVSIEPDMTYRGERVRVTFSEPVDSVTVTYRPGAITARTETFTPGAATFEFEPSRAGVVAVAAGDASQNLSVRFRGAPLGGIVVMVLAGIVLFGGASIALRTLLADGHRIEPDPTMRPDT